ncbi:response regulator of citrate/malate metabolism [Geodermatophilus bullaregiensis]|uniref:response regulator n=1 Tax=Geodermatophilus bullaregiensis TaxID=1564160 RepID=UPI001955FDB2|nr:response regulator [Geodermatophilus bullaregiensis]MBM7808385.1 response regulator of citrate/malate metabolism [Geodermatophilus bullaregiensis]
MIRVLIVDDDFMVARVHAGFVAATDGYEVVGTASTGAAALADVQRLRPDLVLLDVYLPDMTGLEALQRLRAGGSPVDVVVISAARDVDSIRSALHGGVLHYLVKPFDRRTFERWLADYAAVRADLAHGTQLAQDDVDRLFGRRAAAGTPPVAATPKGISPETLELVRGALVGAGRDGLSASEASERTGLARVSARRYLEQLVAQQEADVRQRYGTAGRPERRFTARSAREATAAGSAPPGSAPAP